jgi:enoyl-CoA hydratase/carnithine racemase
LILTLNRPEMHNAFDRPMAQALDAQVDRLDSEDALHAAVLTGGPQFFCADVDLRAPRLAANDRAPNDARAGRLRGQAR